MESEVNNLQISSTHFKKWGSFMEKGKVNPLAAQSKEWLLDALLQLMSEKNYNDITIKELTKRADLDRKTFYRHFNNKDELLMLPLAEAFEQYVIGVQKLPDSKTTKDILVVYFQICLKYMDYLMLLHANDLLLNVLTKFQEYLPILSDIFSNDTKIHKRTSYETFFQVGGFWNVTRQWIIDGAKETPEEMAEIISSMISLISV